MLNSRPTFKRLLTRCGTASAKNDWRSLGHQCPGQCVYPAGGQAGPPGVGDGLSLGGGFDPIHNAVSVAEHAIEKGATTLLIPISARKQLNELTDEMVTKINILFCADIWEALLKGWGE